MRLTPFDKLGVMVLIIRTWLNATAQARALGLTLDEWKQAVRSTSILIQCGYTPDEIEAAARMLARGKADQ